MSQYNDEDFYEDDEEYYEDLEYDDLSDYDNYSTNDEEYIEYDRDDYGEYVNTTYDDIDTEEESKKYHLKDTVKKVLIIILILLVFLIGFMFLKSIKKNKTSTNNNDIKIVKKEKIDYEDIFIKMKDASLKYFTEEHLKEENELTLSKMKNMELIDSIDDSYNLDKSTSSINNNMLKISVFKDNKNKTKTYIVGNYIYCKDTYYCEKSAIMESKTYEYVKEGEEHISNWSNWSEYEETSCDTSDRNCDSTDKSCLLEIKTKTKTMSNKKNMVYQTERNAFATIQKEIGQVCSNYDYVKINGKYYRTDKDSNFKVLGLIKNTTKSDYYNWKYNGRKKYHVVPNDTINTHYIFVREDYSNCGSTCVDHPDYYYDSYTFTKNMYEVINTTSDCNTYITKVIPNYVIEKQKITVSREENENINVCYKSERKRNISKDENIIKWDSYNNEKLLKNGYTYTGNYK